MPATAGPQVEHHGQSEASGSSSGEAFSPSRPSGLKKQRTVVVERHAHQAAKRPKEGPSFLVFADTFLRVAENRDRLLKLLGYSLRLVMWHNLPSHGICMLGADSAADALARLKRLEGSVVDCRMLLNHFKYLQSFQAILGTLADDRLLPLERGCMLVRNALWTQEVVASDLNYLIKYVLTHWDAARSNWHYKFGKSTQLTVLFFVELWRLRRLHRAAAARGELRPAERQQLLFKKLTLVRCICDCIIYYAWIERYNPHKGFSYLCGFVSASCGLYTSVVSHYQSLKKGDAAAGR
eukprot:TRINITY_DN10834_c0_g1_i1.p1 TRINITY_DN10834_c0_g1~~TRINITY_DN10834_c0_g1_i1.p1  ORF type:complete len:319 (+),score=77.03 TRINITY_DN10834_c0_g1_i1:75-959(+)